MMETQAYAAEPRAASKSSNLGNLGNNLMNVESSWRLKIKAQAGEPRTVLKSSNLGNLSNLMKRLKIEVQ